MAVEKIWTEINELNPIMCELVLENFNVDMEACIFIWCYYADFYSYSKFEETWGRIPLGQTTYIEEIINRIFWFYLRLKKHLMRFQTPNNRKTCWQPKRLQNHIICCRKDRPTDEFSKSWKAHLKPIDNLFQCGLYKGHKVFFNTYKQTTNINNH